MGLPKNLRGFMSTSSRMVSFDLETYLIAPGNLAPKIVCGSFADDTGSWLSLRDEAVESITDWLQDRSSGPVAGANIAFDFGCLLAEKPSLFPLVWKAYEDGRIWDVQIAQTLVAISEGRLQDGFIFTRSGDKLKSNGKITTRYSLASCVSEVLGRTDAKRNDAYRLRYGELDSIPFDEWPAEAKQYPLDDAQNTLEVAVAQRDSGFEFIDLPAQCLTAFCLHLSAMTGLRTNAAKVQALEAGLAAKRDQIVRECQKFSLIRSDGSRDTALIRSLVEKDYPEAPRTAGGQISMSRDTLAHARSPELQTLSKLSAIDKHITYLPTLQEAARVPLNTRYNILLATGRASSESMVQLLPRKGGIRECFEARGIYSSCDYPAVEMITLAEVCMRSVRYSQMAKAINAGMDLHCLLASKMIGMPYEAYKAKYESDETLTDLRQAGKAANFGFPGMMGPAKFVEAKLNEGSSVCQWMHGKDGKCGVKKLKKWRDKDLKTALCERCIESAQKLRQYYLETWPEIRDYWKYIESQLEGGGGRIQQFVSGRLRGGLTAPQAANTLFQGLAADAAKKAVRQMTKEMYLDKSSALYGSRLVVFNHDETIIDSPTERASMAAVRQAEVMQECLQFYTPNVKVAKLKPVLMKSWQKSAKQVFDSEGKLLPWVPV